MLEARGTVEETKLLQNALSGIKSISDVKLTAMYDPQSGILSITWKGEVNSFELRQGYMRITELVRLHKPQKWFLNLRDRSEVSEEDRRWIFKYIFPKALRIVGENIYLAVLLPVYAYQGLIHYLSGDELIYKDNFMIIEHFLLQDDSMNWLASVV